MTAQATSASIELAEPRHQGAHSGTDELLDLDKLEAELSRQDAQHQTDMGDASAKTAAAAEDEGPSTHAPQAKYAPTEPDPSQQPQSNTGGPAPEPEGEAYPSTIGAKLGVKFFEGVPVRAHEHRLSWLALLWSLTLPVLRW